MTSLDALLQEGLGVTPNGTCKKHTNVSIFSDEKSVIYACRMCLAEQAQKNTNEFGSVEGAPALSMSKDPSFDNLSQMVARWCQMQSINGQTDSSDVATPLLLFLLQGLQQRVEKQETAIEQLQNTVDQQTKAIRDSLSRIENSVSTSSDTTGSTFMEKQNDRKKKGDIFINMQLKSDNAKVAPVQRVPFRRDQSLRNKRFSSLHPSNIFQSFRTQERQPPKPPQRHNSFKSFKSGVSNGRRPSGVSLESDETDETSLAFTAADLGSKYDMPHLTAGGEDSFKSKKSTAPLEIIWDASARQTTHREVFPSPESIFGNDPSVTSEIESKLGMDMTSGAKLRTKSAEVTTQNGPRIPRRSHSLASGARKSDFHPPSPPPKVRKSFARLPSTAPVNSTSMGSSREIFFGSQPSQQISCLTLDTALPSMDIGESTREVENLNITDKCSEKGSYTGSMHGNMPHGLGTMKYENGGYYKGDWKDGSWHGRGFLRNANSDTYEGDFVYDTRHGRGVYKYENGDVYEGDFSSDKRHGKGSFMFSNGNVYRGDFAEGNFEGYGWYEFEDGYYEGEWKAGLYHGAGTLQYKDGTSYTGTFDMGIADGMGEEVTKEGTRVGEFKNGEFTAPKPVDTEDLVANDKLSIVAEQSGD